MNKSANKATPEELVKRLREEAKVIREALEKDDSIAWPVSIVFGLLGVAQNEDEAADLIESLQKQKKQDGSI